ncbi:MAG: ABC transporter permease [Dysgonamonadaceae bacterium]|jgi:ABC-type multidrug transport system permease subunit|nr:ABC transporter permease [Dysgonamonadaceae bacterium]
MKNLKNNQLYRLTYSAFLETIREPEVLFWGMLFPVLISIGLGLAFTQKSVSKHQIMIVDVAANHVITDGGRQTQLDSILAAHATPREIGGKNAHTWTIQDNTLGDTEFNFVRSDWEASIIALKRGEADLILTDSGGTVCYYFDPHNSQAQLVYMKISALLKSSGQTVNTDKPSISPLTLKGVRYIDFLIPGLIVFGVMSSVLWGISYTIIEKRSQKLLRRLVATPMKKSNFLIALMFVRIMMNIVEALVLFFFAWLIFDIRIQGNIGALIVLFLAGNIGFTGIAVLISCQTSKTEVGTGWINAVQMPMMILSGIFFSYHNFPEWSIGFIKALPLTAFADGVRSIFNEGAGWVEILMPSLSLSAFGIICFLIGLRLFKWY